MLEDERTALENRKLKAIHFPPSPNTPVGATIGTADLVQLAHATGNVGSVVGTPTEPLSDTLVRYNIMSTESVDLRCFAGKSSAVFAHNVHINGIPTLPVFSSGFLSDFPLVQ